MWLGRVEKIGGAIDASLGQILPDEVARDRLVDRLAERWNVRLLVVEAPGGYGKSTALAQAVRDNAGDPSGVDVVLRLSPLHRSVDQVLDELADRLLDGDVDGTDPSLAQRSSLARVVRAVEAHSPVDVTVWIDDAHRIIGFDDEGRLGDLLDVLPANGHLALLGRSLPRLPIARLAAADDVAMVGVDELRFDDTELAALAAAHGVEPETVAHADGWPAMSRLALVSDAHSREYVFDEVVSSMSPAQRFAVAVARLAGRADASLLAACGVEVDVGDLVRTVPLLTLVDGSIEAHDLWSDFDVELVPESERSGLIATIADSFADRRRFRDAIELAIRHDAWPVVMNVLVQLFYEGDAHLGASDSTRWTHAIPPAYRSAPEALLLAGVHARLSGGVNDGLADVHAAVDGFDDAGNDRGLAACLIELGTRAWLVDDGSVLRPALRVVPGLIERGEPKMLGMIAGREASEADLRGEYREALQHYRRAGFELDAGLRHRATLLFFLGERDDSIELVDELVRRDGSRFNERIRATHHFMCGRPGPVLGDGFPGLDVVDNSREQPLHHMWESVIAASLGRRPPLDSFERLELPRTREQMFLVVARALDAVVTHQPSVASRVIDEAIERFGADDPLVVGELIRFIGFVRIASAAAREALASFRPTGWNAERAAIADLVLAGRDAGTIRVRSMPSAERLFTVLPLPWSVEAVALAANDDVDHAGRLLDQIAGLAGRAVADELRWLAAGETAASEGARRLLAAVPIPPDIPSELSLLGSPGVVCGDRRSELTSTRAATVLALLALEGPLGRGELAERVWPATPDSKRLASLRTALKQARELLEPDRDRGIAPFHLRERAGLLELADTEHLSVDIREVGRLLDLADSADGRAADGRGDAATARGRAFELLGGGWIPAYDDVPDLADALRAVSVRATEAMCLTAERRVAAGDHDGAAALADLVIGRDEYVERAHAVRLAAELGRGDLDGASRAIERCLSMLGELGVEPEPGTRMLIRRYERRSGDAAGAERSAG